MRLNSSLALWRLIALRRHYLLFKKRYTVWILLDINHRWCPQEEMTVHQGRTFFVLALWWSYIPLSDSFFCSIYASRFHSHVQDLELIKTFVQFKSRPLRVIVSPPWFFFNFQVKEKWRFANAAGEGREIMTNRPIRSNAPQGRSFCLWLWWSYIPLSDSFFLSLRVIVSWEGNAREDRDPLPQRPTCTSKVSNGSTNLRSLNETTSLPYCVWWSIYLFPLLFFST